MDNRLGFAGIAECLSRKKVLLICSGASALLLAAALVVPLTAAASDTDAKKPDPKVLAQGRALFEREWQPGDSRTHGGDGLGPVYNDSSCVACHNLGGTGGAGSNGKNVDIITATPNGQNVQPQPGEGQQPRGFIARALRSLVGLDEPAPAPAAATGKESKDAKAAKPPRPKIDTTALVKAHPGFRTARSIVLHHFGTDDRYDQWRQGFAGMPGMGPGQSPFGDDRIMAVQMTVNFDAMQMQNQIGPFAISRSQRNPTSLFGSGLIDLIPESAIEAAAKAKHPGFSQIAGRVSRLKDNRVGRFGWKAQTASLSDFVLTACAVELGLEVPAHHQAGSPQHPDALPKGLDLNSAECDSLIAYVGNLPQPTERTAESDREAAEIQQGRALFAKVGCATCHLPKLGEVDGVYTDLLLHDMGLALGDVGQYGVFDPSSSEDEIVDDPASVADAGVPPFLPAAAEENAVTVATAPAPDPASAPAQGARATPFDQPGTPQVAQVPPPSVVIQAPPVPPTDGSVLPVSPPAAVSGSFVSGPIFAFQPTPTGFGGSPGVMKRPTSGPASRFEWRTPPLWGFRDSAPYLHDGRAKTLDQTIAFHGGEANSIAQQFFKLSAKERRQVEAFLKSLTAPAPRDLVAARVD